MRMGGKWNWFRIVSAAALVLIVLDIQFLLPVTKGASRLLVLHLVSVSKSGRFHENEPKQRDQPQPWLESLATPATVTLRL
jgi:hypothetical protein